MGCINGNVCDTVATMTIQNRNKLGNLAVVDVAVINLYQKFTF
jgi:hypothetical protein